MNHWFNNKKKFENKRKRDEAKEIIDLKGNWEEKEEDDDICVCVSFPVAAILRDGRGVISRCFQADTTSRSSDPSSTSVY